MASTQREHFRDRLKKLRFGIFLSWVLNTLVLTFVVEAGLIISMLSAEASNSDIAGFILTTLPVSFLVALFVVWIYSLFADRAVIANAAPGAKEVTDGQVYNLVEEMAIAAGISHRNMPKVYVLDSPEANAFAISNKKESAVIVTTGIMNVLNREELQAVIAHEIGHITSGDSQAMVKLVGMSSMISLIAGIATRMFLWGGSGSNRNRSSNNGVNPVAVIVIVLSLAFLVFAPLISNLLQFAMSRQRESQADALSVAYTRNPTALSTALQKISQTSVPRSERTIESHAGQLAFVNLHKLTRTHPPIEQRVNDLRKMGASA